MREKREKEKIERERKKAQQKRDQAKRSHRQDPPRKKKSEFQADSARCRISGRFGHDRSETRAMSGLRQSPIVVALFCACISRQTLPRTLFFPARHPPQFDVTSSISASFCLFNNHTSSIHNGVSCKSLPHPYVLSDLDYPLINANTASRQPCSIVRLESFKTANPCTASSPPANRT